MTQQEIEKSIAILLVKAVEGGWNNKRFKDVIDYITDCVSGNYLIEVTYHPSKHSFELYFLVQTVDLDALIVHHEDGEISFVEALCELQNKLVTVIDLDWTEHNHYVSTETVVGSWNFIDSNKIRPTSECLTWFLGVFEHLLK